MSVPRADDGEGLDSAYELHEGDALGAYRTWPTPTTIVSDGAYGVGGFHGDPRTPDSIAAWYRPHIEEWSRRAHPSTTLWFWNTEIGWASVHPLLLENGWEYEFTNIWDKGVAHIAGNVNGKTLRRFPVVTEVCVFYSRRLVLPTPTGVMPAQEWMRYEWQRTGLPLYLANEACGVRNAATRKYLTADWLWYFPPAEMMERLVTYANENGDPTGRPYYSFDGKSSVSGQEWATLRYKWRHKHGVTNVWSHPPLNGSERFKGTGIRAAPRVYKPSSVSTAHLNQKPLEFMRRIIEASTEPGDVIWEPFGGLCSATVAAIELGRRGFVAERDPIFVRLAKSRLRNTMRPPLLLTGELGKEGSPAAKRNTRESLTH